MGLIGEPTKNVPHSLSNVILVFTYILITVTKLVFKSAKEVQSHEQIKTPKPLSCIPFYTLTIWSVQKVLQVDMLD